jgi:protein required for attachment to host cells
LEVSLKELIKRGKHPQVRKIVITSSPDYQGNFRRNLVSYVKERLMEENIKVLINCSVWLSVIQPQKLLKAGCECYL